jgi:undecaprenyl-diphosphatase
LGVAQAFALIPGFSRSGLVMAAGLVLGLARPAAVRFAFLLSVPAILGASITQMPALFQVESAPWAAYAVGFCLAAVSGYAAIAGLLRWVGRRTLVPFVWYRLLLAAAVVAFAV